MGSLKNLGQKRDSAEYEIQKADCKIQAQKSQKAEILQKIEYAQIEEGLNKMLLSAIRNKLWCCDTDSSDDEFSEGNK